MKINESSRIQKTTRNVIFAFLNQVVTLILNIVNRTVFIRIMGVEFLGINGLFSDILAMLSLADLGLGTAMVYSYYKPLGEKDQVKLAQLTQFYRKVYRIIAVVVISLGVCLIPFLKYLVNLDNDIPHLYVYYMLMVVNTASSYLFVYKTSILSADQKNYIVSRNTTIINCCRMLCQIIILLVFRSYILYLVVNICSTFAINLLSSHKADELYPYINEKVGPLGKCEQKNIFSNIKSMALYKVSTVVFSSTDNTLISVLVGTIWIGYYSNYNMIITAINGFVNLVYNSATASIGNIIATEKEERRYEAFKMMQIFSLIATTITTLCMLLLINDFLALWLGDSFTFNNVILISILANYYFNGLVHPIWSFREACGLYRRTKYIMLIAAAVNLALSVILGIRFGIAGILFASLIARISTYFWYEPKILFGEYFMENVKNYYRPLIQNVVFVVLLGSVSYLTLGRITVTSWLLWVLKAILTFAVISLITIIFYMKDQNVKKYIRRYLPFVKFIR